MGKPLVRSGHLSAITLAAVAKNEPTVSAESWRAALTGVVAGHPSHSRLAVASAWCTRCR
jgi:hypothetical protein